MTSVRTDSTTVSVGLLAVGIVSVLALASCDEHPEIEITLTREYTYEKTPEEEIAEMLEWAVPTEWEQLPTRPLRIVNMRAGEVECYVTYLTGGTAAGNINRWRSQMGLPPASPIEISAMQEGKLLKRDAHRIDISGTWTGRGRESKSDYRLIARYAQFPRFAMSVKMLGPKAAVDEAARGFDEFCESLSFKGRFGNTANDEPGGSAHNSNRPKLKWDVPDGWQEVPGHEMRHVTFSTGGATNCWITFLSSASGTWKENVTRWQGEIGESPLDAVALAALSKLSLFEKQVPLLESHGKTESVLGVMAILPDANMFVKLTGPKAFVKAQKSRFEAFCKSLRLDE